MKIMGKRMTIQTAKVAGYEFSKDKNLRALHGQTVTVLCGSQFYNPETEETLRIKRDLQNLVCTEDYKYAVVDSKYLITDHTYQKASSKLYDWNPCPPEKWQELEDKKAFTKAVESIPEASESMEQ